MRKSKGHSIDVKGYDIVIRIDDGEVSLHYTPVTGVIEVRSDDFVIDVPDFVDEEEEELENEDEDEEEN